MSRSVYINIINMWTIYWQVPHYLLLYSLSQWWLILLVVHSSLTSISIQKTLLEEMLFGFYRQNNNEHSSANYFSTLYNNKYAYSPLSNAVQWTSKKYYQLMFSTALRRRMVVQLTQLGLMHYCYPLNNTK